MAFATTERQLTPSASGRTTDLVLDKELAKSSEVRSRVGQTRSVLYNGFYAAHRLFIRFRIGQAVEAPPTATCLHEPNLVDQRFQPTLRAPILPRKDVCVKVPERADFIAPSLARPIPREIIPTGLLTSLAQRQTLLAGLATDFNCQHVRIISEHVAVAAQAGEVYLGRPTRVFTAPISRPVTASKKLQAVTPSLSPETASTTVSLTAR